MTEEDKKKWTELARIQDRVLDATIDTLEGLDEKAVLELCYEIDNSYRFLKLLIGLFPDQKFFNKFENIVIGFALSGNPTQLMYAQSLIRNLPDSWHDTRLFELIVNFLSIEDNRNDYYTLRNAARVLEKSNQIEGLKLLLNTYCSDSGDLDIDEIYTDFWPK